MGITYIEALNILRTNGNLHLRSEDSNFKINITGGESSYLYSTFTNNFGGQTILSFNEMNERLKHYYKLYGELYVQ